MILNWKQGGNFLRRDKGSRFYSVPSYPSYLGCQGLTLAVNSSIKDIHRFLEGLIISSLNNGALFSFVLVNFCLFFYVLSSMVSPFRGVGRRKITTNTDTGAAGRLPF